jgi:hypothetical protein
MAHFEKPVSAGPRQNAGRLSGTSVGDWVDRNPISGSGICCACVASGHAAAPSPAMKSRRRIDKIPRLRQPAYRDIG